METGVGTAVKAAEGIINYSPVLGGLVVILGAGILALLIYHFRETGRLNRELLESERQHGKDALTMQSGVTMALDTVKQALEFITKRGQ